jgi:hypothetical protein
MEKMENQKYNGWSNYATWRINLEWFDGDSVNGDADYLREYVEEALECSCDNETTLSYAMAFLSDVNWNEIAQSMEDRKIEELIYEFNTMKSMPIIEIELENGEYAVYNISAKKEGLATDNGISIEWDLDNDLDKHLEALMEAINETICQ